jgi:hypothetical protein
MVWDNKPRKSPSGPILNQSIIQALADWYLPNPGRRAPEMSSCSEY